MGAFGSFLNVFGGLVCCLAFSTGAPQGGISALVSSQMVTLTVFEAVTSMVIPNYMQIIGLVIGICGTLTLALPDVMYKFFLILTCQCGKMTELKAKKLLYEQEEKELKDKINI
jgi:hypothetical protein